MVCEVVVLEAVIRGHVPSYITPHSTPHILQSAQHAETQGWLLCVRILHCAWTSNSWCLVGCARQYALCRIVIMLLFGWLLPCVHFVWSLDKMSYVVWGCCFVLYGVYVCTHVRPSMASVFGRLCTNNVFV